MAETKFIKAAAFGGYDKADVDKRLDFLYSVVYDLKNELRESKLLLQAYRSGADAAAGYESVLSSERATITQIQVKNENLSERNKAIKEEIRLKEAENAELRETVAELQSKLSEAELSLSSVQGNSTDAIGSLFVDAQKSHDKIIANANEKARTIEDSARKFAEDFIVETNNQASKIVYTAERQAAEIIADARNQSEQMRAAAGNLRASLYAEIRELSERAEELRKIITAFSESNAASITRAIELLATTEETLSKDGVPVFEKVQEVRPEYPPEPVYQKVKPAADKKRTSDLEKLQAMADAIGGGSEQPQPVPQTPKTSKPSISLDEIARQSESLAGDKKPPEVHAEEHKKPAPLSLDDLLRQASELDS